MSKLRLHMVLGPVVMLSDRVRFQSTLPILLKWMKGKVRNSGERLFWKLVNKVMVVSMIMEEITWRERAGQSHRLWCLRELQRRKSNRRRAGWWTPGQGRLQGWNGQGRPRCQQLHDWRTEEGLSLSGDLQQRQKQGDERKMRKFRSASVSSEARGRRRSGYSQDGWCRKGLGMF